MRDNVALVAGVCELRADGPPVRLMVRAVDHGRAIRRDAVGDSGGRVIQGLRFDQHRPEAEESFL